MRFSKSVMTLIAGASISGMASAQEAATPVAAENKAFMQQLLPTSYMSLELRHKTNRKMERDEVLKDTAVLQARPTLGATFFDKKLVTEITPIFVKATDTTAVTKSTLFSEVSLTAIETNALDVKGYAYNEFAGGFDKFATSDVMLLLTNDGKDSAKTNTAIGEIGFLAEEYVGVQLTSGKKRPDSTVARRPGMDPVDFGLQEGDTATEIKIKQREPDINTITVLLPYIKPAIVPGLKLSAGFEGYTTHKPKYETVGDSSEKSGYALSSFVVNRASVSYKISDKVSVYNSVRQTVDGAWARGVDASDADAPARWENRLGLVATLF